MLCWIIYIYMLHSTLIDGCCTTNQTPWSSRIGYRHGWAPTMHVLCVLYIILELRKLIQSNYKRLEIRNHYIPPSHKARCLLECPWVHSRWAGPERRCSGIPSGVRPRWSSCIFLGSLMLYVLQGEGQFTGKSGDVVPRYELCSLF